MARTSRINHLWSAPVTVVILTCATLLSGSASAAFVQQRQLTVTDATNLGDTVALSANGDTAVVGASDDNAGAGAAFVFTRSDGVWSQPQKLTGNAASGAFGTSVAASADGNTILVGDPGNDSDTGAGWVFVRSSESSSFVLEQELTPGDADGGAGHSVSLSADGDTALLGAPGDGGGAGAAWTFTRTGATWSAPQQLLGAAESGGQSAFGDSVALSGDGSSAVVGGPEDGNGDGAVWFFTRSGSSFAPEGSKLQASSDLTGAPQFGYSVALSQSGQTAVIGAPTSAGDVGAAWVLSRSGSAWGQQLITGAEELGAARFGATVALSADGSTALVGGPDDSAGVGSVWLFTRTGSSFVLAEDKLPGDSAEGEFGSSVTLSGDGNTALAGSPGASAGVEGTATVLVLPPAVTRVRPAGGPTAGGTSVTITGSNLNGATAVRFGSVPAEAFTVLSADELTAISPPGRGGTVAITVTTAAGSTSSPTFQYTGPPPTLTHVSESHKTWRASSKLAQISSARAAPLGTTFSFTLNQAATVKLAFTLDRPGRRSGKRCVAETGSNRHQRKCTRTSGAGTLSIAAPSGADKLAFYGRLSRSTRVRPGSYTVAVTAGAGGKTSNAVRLSFTIDA
jgi:IPT/TIG domain/FG-GAP repeat